MYAQAGKPIDCESIKQCHAMVKQSTGLFSAFRGNMALFVATSMSLSPNPQELLNNTLNVYAMLKSVKFRASDYLIAAACQIASQAEPSKYASVVDRARAFYDNMKRRHRLHIGQGNYIYAAMLGLSGLDVEVGSERAEQIFDRLKGDFWDKSSVRALAQVLTLGGSSDEAVWRVLAMKDEFKALKIKLFKTYALPLFGVLALLPNENGKIVHEIGQAQQTLRAQKGFGPLSVTSIEVFMLATAIVADCCMENDNTGALAAALHTCVINVIVAQEVAMIVAVNTSSSAAASST